jgi:D-glycero-alpha-D-manno-heptose 1-phosphate guanylyltransferase
VFNFELSRVCLSLHYKPELFQKYINKSIHKENLSSVVEPEPLGTGGAIYYVIKHSNVSSPFFVINGDSLSDIDLNHMVEEFEKYQYKAMIGISKVDDTKRYGTVSVQNGNVISFNEKGISGCGWINNGHYILTKEVFNEFTGSFSLEKDLFPKLAQNCELGAYKVPNDNFMDMGVPEDYAKLCKKMLEESN